MYNGEGTVFGSINSKALKQMSCTIPSVEAVEKFEKIVAPMDKAIRNNYDEISRLKNLRDTLLPKLMSGEIDVEDVEF